METDAATLPPPSISLMLVEGSALPVSAFLGATSPHRAR